MGCIFCHREEPNARQADELEWIVCGICTQRLQSATPAVLQKAHALAIEKGFHQKADVLKSFLPEVVNEQRNPKRNFIKRAYRKRVNGLARDKQKSDWKAPKRKTPSLHQVDRSEQAIL